jgi:hypothetical protein
MFQAPSHWSLRHFVVLEMVPVGENLRREKKNNFNVRYDVLLATTTTITLLCDVTPCRKTPTFRRNVPRPSLGPKVGCDTMQFGNSPWCRRKLLPHSSRRRHEDGGSVSLRNVGKRVPNHTATHSRNQLSSDDFINVRMGSVSSICPCV